MKTLALAALVILAAHFAAPAVAHAQARFEHKASSGRIGAVLSVGGAGAEASALQADVVEGEQN